MRIIFQREEFILDSSGALIWPDQNMLIVSDLHLEKGSFFAKKGFFLPPYDSRKILTRLSNVIDIYKPKKILILGDCFHDPKGYERLPIEDRLFFDKLVMYHPIWIKGNHDGDFVPPNFESHEFYQIGKVCFCHEAVPGVTGEISGHFHPKAELIFDKRRISYPCFIEDGHKMIVPAFGAYTGGLSVMDKIFRNFLSDTPNYYILGEGRVYKLSEIPVV